MLIAQVQETTRTMEQRLKEKDDYIELLKSQKAPEVLSVLKAAEELRERAIGVLETRVLPNWKSRKPARRKNRKKRLRCFESSCS